MTLCFHPLPEIEPALPVISGECGTFQTAWGPLMWDTCKHRHHQAQGVRACFWLPAMQSIDSPRWTSVHMGAKLTVWRIFQESEFGSQLLQGTLDLPPPAPLNDTNTSTLPVFLGDEAFPLDVHLMCHIQVIYSDIDRFDIPLTSYMCSLFWLWSNVLHLFACRYQPWWCTDSLQSSPFHSKTRRVIEDAFGVLATRWRILGRPIDLHQTVDVVKISVALHKLLTYTDAAASHTTIYIPPGFVDRTAASGEILPGKWRRLVAGDNGLLEPVRLSTARASQDAVSVRDTLKSYFRQRRTQPLGELYKLCHI